MEEPHNRRTPGEGPKVVIAAGLGGRDDLGGLAGLGWGSLVVMQESKGRKKKGPFCEEHTPHHTPQAR